MAITTNLLRGALDDAYEIASKSRQPLRDVLRSSESLARKAIAGGSLSSVSANRRSSEFSQYGEGQLTAVEAAELWRELITGHDRARAWLSWCFRYGFDPNQAELDRVQSTSTPPAENPSPVTDADIYEWLMGSEAVANSVRGWPGKLLPITELRSDYSGLYTSTAGYV